MKERKATIVDMNYDGLKEILIRVAKSSNGAKDLGNVICVCKTFRQFVEDEDVLRAVAFDNLLLSDRWELFQQRDGLINRCAQVGHTEAQVILAKIILVSASQLLRAHNGRTNQEASSFVETPLAQAALFIENFLPGRTNPHTCGSHFDLVRFFLSRVRLCEFKGMQPFVVDYMEYFLRCKGHKGEIFFLTFDGLCSVTLDHLMKMFLSKFAECSREIWLHMSVHKNIYGVEAEQFEAWAEEKGKGGHVGGGSSSSSSSTSILEKLDESVSQVRTMATIYNKGVQTIIPLLTGKGNSEHIDYFTDFVAAVEDIAVELKAKALMSVHMRDNLIWEFDELVSNL